MMFVINIIYKDFIRKKTHNYVLIDYIRKVFVLHEQNHLFMQFVQN